MWAPEDKIGRHFTAVHAPVADNRLIIGAAPQLVRLVTGGALAPETPSASPPRGGDGPLGRPGGALAPETPSASPPRGGDGPLGRPGGADRTDRWERFVWTLSAHPRLHAHPQRVDPARWAGGLDDDTLAAQTWWRTERQTFIPLPPGADGQAQAVFTILVDVAPLAQALAGPAQAARLHDALASMSDAVLAYRGLTAVRAPLLRWLARQAAGAGAGAAAHPQSEAPAPRGAAAL
jgi:hypothetical protein